MRTTPLLLSLLLAGCNPAAPPQGNGPATPEFEKTGTLEASGLEEASGLQAGENGVFYVHDDEETLLYVIDASGQDLGVMPVTGASNKDWEDITRVMGDDGPLLVIGDTGDNLVRRKKVRLYFVREPLPGSYDGELPVVHKLDVRYPDGPHDVEAMAYDSSSDRILFLSKRDQPPRLYGIPMDLALWQDEVDAVFLAEVPGFRPPTRKDILLNPKRGMWISQPTGMDISPDGKTAAVITYRSLYVFRRESGEAWKDAFQRAPVEFVGPPGSYEEAVTFGPEQGSVYVTTERRPAPIYKINP